LSLRSPGKARNPNSHLGLVPAFEYFGDCSGEWGFYIRDSLRSPITKSKGQPISRKS
jgi:hypothetical protein